jgi:phage replication-related protein YjqB (UPF0714/DUF867 family)
VLLTLLAAAALAADRYPNLAALRADKKEGVDFRVETLDRSSPVTVLAIHGGKIEPGSSALARRLAGQDWNLYLFEGLSAPAHDLHVTAAHFDDPPAVALALRSTVAVSIHGEKGITREACVGGADLELARRVADALRQASFAAEQPCRRLPGESPKNIVNRAKSGVQLEMTKPFLDLLNENAGEMERFVKAVRSAIPNAKR